MRRSRMEPPDRSLRRCFCAFAQGYETRERSDARLGFAGRQIRNGPLLRFSRRRLHPLLISAFGGVDAHAVALVHKGRDLNHQTGLQPRGFGDVGNRCAAQTRLYETVGQLLQRVRVQIGFVIQARRHIVRVRFCEQMFI